MAQILRDGRIVWGGDCKKRLIAEELPLVLREAWGGESVPLCDREENFQEMYIALGDRDAQDEIRKDNPHASHCSLLKNKSSSFCTDCPNNPHRIPDSVTSKPVAERYHAIQRAKQMGFALERAIWLMDMADLGQRTAVEKMRPTDLILLRIARRSWRSHEAVIQGHIIANEIAKLFGPMFNSR